MTRMEMDIEKYRMDFEPEFIPPHTPFHMSPEEYWNLGITQPSYWQRLLYCRHTETAYELEPENDPRDLNLIHEYQRCHMRSSLLYL